MGDGLGVTLGEGLADAGGRGVLGGLGFVVAFGLGADAGVASDFNGSAFAGAAGRGVARGTDERWGAAAGTGFAEAARVVGGGVVGAARRCAATVSAGDEVGADVAGGSCWDDAASASGSASALAWVAIAADSAITDAIDRPAETTLAPRAGPTRRVEGRWLLTPSLSARNQGGLLLGLVRPGENGCREGQPEAAVDARQAVVARVDSVTSASWPGPTESSGRPSSLA